MAHSHCHPIWWSIELWLVCAATQIVCHAHDKFYQAPSLFCVQHWSLGMRSREVCVVQKEPCPPAQSLHGHIQLFSGMIMVLIDNLVEIMRNFTRLLALTFLGLSICNVLYIYIYYISSRELRFSSLSRWSCWIIIWVVQLPIVIMKLIQPSKIQAMISQGVASVHQL